VAMFYALYVPKKFFHPNFRDDSPEKFFSTFLGKIRKKFGKSMEKIWKNWKKYGKIAKIWHRGNFRPKIVIFETGCGNFRPKIVIFETRCCNFRPKIVISL
jgi:hypothetical protein